MGVSFVPAAPHTYSTRAGPAHAVQTHTHHTSSERLAAVATIVLTLVGWSSIPLFLRHFAGSIDFWTANGWRYAISALIWAPVLLWSWKRNSMPPGLWKAALVPSLFNILGQLFFGWAPYLMEPGLMTFSLRVQIVFVAVGAALLFPIERELLRRPMFIGGLATVLAGTMATVALKEGGLGKGSALGVVVAVLSGLFYTGYALCVRKYMHGMHPLKAFAAVSQYTALGLVGLMLAFGEQHGAAALHLSTDQLWLLVLSSVIGIGLGHTFYFFSLARLGVAVSSGVVQLQPFIVSVASMHLFGEKLTGKQWIMGTIAVTGAAVMLVAQHRFAGQKRREMLEAARGGAANS